MFDLRRREFITLLGGAVAWPLPASAQQTLPTIGFLSPVTASVENQRVAAFVQRLRAADWIEGHSVAIKVRWADGRSERAAEIVAEFVQQKVDVPVGTGFVVMGGNVTGLSFQQTDLAGKRLELLREVVPALRRLAILANAGNPVTLLDMREVEAAAGTLGLTVVMVEIRRMEDIARGLRGGEGWRGYGPPDPLLSTHQPDSHQYFRPGRAAAHDARVSGLRRSGKSDVLWSKLPRPVPARGRLRRQGSARSEARRSPGRAADQIRSHHQSDHRQSAGSHHSAYAARAR